MNMLVSSSALTIGASTVSASTGAPSAVEPGYRGPGLYLGPDVAYVMIGSPITECAPLVASYFAPMMFVDLKGAVHHANFQISDVEERGLTLAVAMDPKAVESLGCHYYAVVGESLQPDPVFAAIDRHKAMQAAFGVECGRYDEIEKPTAEDEAAYGAADAAERGALFDLADCVPTTEKGARAALTYLVRVAGEHHYRVLGVFGASLIEAKWSSL